MHTNTTGGPHDRKSAAEMGQRDLKPGIEWGLGARVRFRKPLKRITGYTGSVFGLVKQREWVPSEDETLRDGIIVGKRTLRNGTVRRGDYGMEFAAKGHLTAYLVAYDIHRSPVLVRPGDIKRVWYKVEGEEQ